MDIKAKFQLVLSGHSCDEISRSGDYQYKVFGGREIDTGLEAGRWSRAVPSQCSGPPTAQLDTSYVFRQKIRFALSFFERQACSGMVYQ